MPRGVRKQVTPPAQPKQEAQTEQKASSAPAFVRKMVESQEHTPAAQPPREFNENGELPSQKIQSPDSHHLGGELERLGFDADGKRIRGKKWHDEMAFANELVTVRVHTTTDKNAHPLPDVFVNGRVQRFPRGEEIQVRRCYVERLARAMATSYGCVKTKGADGEDKYIYPKTTAEVYPFTVIGDSAKGEAWLKAIMTSPQ